MPPGPLQRALPEPACISPRRVCESGESHRNPAHTVLDVTTQAQVLASSRTCIAAMAQR
jgi:hypothetical protein